MSITFHVDKLPTVRHMNGSKEALENIIIHTELNISDAVRYAIVEIAKEFGYNETMIIEPLEYLKNQANEIHPVFRCGIVDSVLIRNCLTYYAEKLQVTPP